MRRRHPSRSSPDARLAGVLDWDASLARGWPALDLLHMLAFRRKHRAYKHFGSVVEERFLAGRLGRFDREMVDRYFGAMDLDRELWPALVSLYWLERLSQWIETDLHELRADPDWVVRNMVRAAPRIVARLDAGGPV